MANQKQNPKINPSSTSTARIKIDPLGYGESCVYAGQMYSDGSIVNQDGVRMKCSNGSWETAKKANPVKPARPANKGTK